MDSSRRSQEQILYLLREAQRRFTQGESLVSVCKTLGISQSSYRRWQKKFGEHARANVAPAEGGTTDAVKSRKSVKRWHLIFSSSLFIMFSITCSYPIGMLLTTTKTSYAFTVMR